MVAGARFYATLGILRGVLQTQDEESGGGRDPSRIKPASLVDKPESPKRVLDRWRSFVALDPSDTMLYAELFEEDEEVERKARLSALCPSFPFSFPVRCSQMYSVQGLYRKQPWAQCGLVSRGNSLDNPQLLTKPGSCGILRVFGAVSLSGCRWHVLASHSRPVKVLEDLTVLSPTLPSAGRLNRQHTQVQRSSAERAQHAPPMRAMSMPHGERSVGGWHREGVSDEAASRLADQNIPENAPAGAASLLIANCTALCSPFLNNVRDFLQQPHLTMQLTHAQQQRSSDDTAMQTLHPRMIMPASLPAQAAS